MKVLNRYLSLTHLHHFLRLFLVLNNGIWLAILLWENADLGWSRSGTKYSEWWPLISPRPLFRTCQQGTWTSSFISLRLPSLAVKVRCDTCGPCRVIWAMVFALEDLFEFLLLLISTVPLWCWNWPGKEDGLTVTRLTRPNFYCG